MKTLVVYDSAYGNTEIIARAIGDAIPGDVCVTKVSEADASDLKSLNLLIIGSPVYAGRATQPIQAFMRSIPDGSISCVNTAAFDTRISGWFARLFGRAAPRMSRTLKAKNGKEALAAEGFIVLGKEGPLKEGEFERAAAWAKEIVKDIE